MSYARDRLRRRLNDRCVRALADPIDVSPTRPQPAPLVRGGRSQHPQWYQVLALVRRQGETAWDFVAEAPTLGEASALAMRYPFRALVVDASSKRQFDNSQPIEVEG